jgi:hypothetical protein
MSETEKTEISKTTLEPLYVNIAETAQRPTQSTRGRRQPVARTGPTPERATSNDPENTYGDPNAEEPVRTVAARARRRAPVRTGAATPAVSRT